MAQLWRSMDGTFFVSSDGSLLSIDMWSLATSLDPQILVRAINASAAVLSVYRGMLHSCLLLHISH